MDSFRGFSGVLVTGKIANPHNSRHLKRTASAGVASLKAFVSVAGGKFMYN
jgi:hypothetical protein